MSKKVAVVMGSDSDLDTMRPCISRLKAFGIPGEEIGIVAEGASEIAQP